MGAVTRIVGTAVAAGALVAAGIVASSPPAAASGSGPTIVRGLDEETFFDDFIFELCGITADVTVSERWTRKEFPDGSETLHTVRTFTSSDPRIPLEKGAATSFNSPDGSRVVVGKPVQLFDPDGGLLVMDAGWIALDATGDSVDMRGPHTFLDLDPADLYCP